MGIPRLTPLLSALLVFATVLSHGPAPLPVEATAADFYRGKYLYRLIRITGTVIDAFTDEIDPRFMFLIVSSRRESIYVSIRKPETGDRRLLDLVGSTVSVIGVGARERASRPQNRKGQYLCASSLSAITVIKPPPADRFAVPTPPGRILTPCHRQAGTS